MRVETAVARLASIYANVHSKEEFTLYDFAPHEDEPPISLNKAMETWN